MASKMKDDDAIDKFKSEWRIVGLTLDRSLFVLFFLIHAAVLVGCFVKVPGLVF